VMAMQHAAKAKALGSLLNNMYISM
jgi:hypothetical protein